MSNLNQRQVQKLLQKLSPQQIQMIKLLELPEAGQYFIRVRATNEEGKTQDAFDYYVTDEGKQYGMRCIYVTEDGQIEEDIYEE